MLPSFALGSTVGLDSRRTTTGYRITQTAHRWRVAIGYGLTETSPLLMLNPPGQAKIGSVGRANAQVELRIEHRDDVHGGPVTDRTPGDTLLASHRCDRLSHLTDTLSRSLGVPDAYSRASMTVRWKGVVVDPRPL
jgi:hypothetical protein